MHYYDVMHPINVAWLMYDVVCVTVRSFSPETLVRKRVKRAPKEGREKEQQQQQQQQQQQRGRRLHRSSQPGSRTGSANTSLNVSAYTSGELPPPVPNRNAMDVSRSHRHRSRSGGHSERGKETDDKKRLSTWRDIDVTRQTVLLTHVLRATPITVLRFFCQVQTDAETLPLLGFRDLSDSARRLLQLSAGAVFAPEVVIPFLTARFLLNVAQHYLMERVFFETNLVVRNLRSRRAWRKALGWTLSLSAHTMTDPIAFSVLTPILLFCVRDLSPVTGPLRYSPAGISKGIAVGFAGVVLEMLVVPAASQLCQRAVVRIVDATEYLLLRRYARRAFASSGEAKEEIASNMNSEDERGDLAGSFAGSLNSSRVSNREPAAKTRKEEGAAARRPHDASGKHSHDDLSKVESGSRKLDEHKSEERRRRRREEAENRKKADAEHRVILRAIIYRVCSALISQCLVQHPLTVFAHMLYGRAVLNATGLLTLYDDVPGVPLTWNACLEFLRRSVRFDVGAEQSSGVLAVEILRSIGGFIGYEFGMVRSSIRCFSTRDVAIRDLITRAEANRKNRAVSGGDSGIGESALESVELMLLTIASLSPLFTAVQFTAMEKLLGFYMDVWVRLRGE
ncbi:Tripartite attachment complex protein 65 [Trypanosoma cruzi]|uniref:Tripartite attachment complex protein 65 n=2 Tax=Trypanosoma cruzi TaxID=5693 RepID=Q4D2U1_TRYCC|nr:hypothetical protein, conserved [Trypanosoma cruzi]EAN86841.1 hypothetical protein, conserved [Trypanosoma cruzi]PWU87328.1 Tripartite attachment complex protein 65 [Trypanosoma cruzi]RNC56521.1 hypothetical protein TcCL_ESM05937 [Trypanosoma cruzi]|eukprot:XP_808692.1 hypothetical protein [Trypanosoma cruzi strain CL Brener]